jgi:hypothetical protein
LLPADFSLRTSVLPVAFPFLAQAVSSYSASAKWQAWRLLTNTRQVGFQRLGRIGQHTESWN